MRHKIHLKVFVEIWNIAGSLNKSLQAQWHYNFDNPFSKINFTHPLAFENESVKDLREAFTAA